MATKWQFTWDNFLRGGLLLYVMAAVILSGPIVTLYIVAHQFFWKPTSAVVTQAATGRRPTFTYEYEVNGKLFQSQQYALLMPRSQETDAIREFELGQSLNIYYNPQQPKEAVVSKRKLGPLEAVTEILRLIFGKVFAWMATGLTFFGDVGGLAGRKQGQ